MSTTRRRVVQTVAAVMLTTAVGVGATGCTVQGHNNVSTTDSRDQRDTLNWTYPEYAPNAKSTK